MEIIEANVMNAFVSDTGCKNDSVCKNDHGGCENCYNDCKDSCFTDCCVWD